MNIILYVMDALRPDFLGGYGFHKNTSPNIDVLAKDGVVYENAYSTATWTKASAASIVTSQHPRSLRMLHQMDTMPELENTLPNVLKKNGFQTYAISANAFFSPDFGFSGFDRFFVLQKDPAIVEKERQAKEAKDIPQDKTLKKLGIDKLVVPRSEDINKKVFPILENEEENNRFIIIWSADTHGPYYVKGNKSYFGNSLDDFILEKKVNKRNLEKVKSLYCDMIRYNDYHFGRLVSRLKKEGLYENSLIIVTADHGNSFGDHNLILGKPIIGHSSIVYEEVIKVPLIIKYPYNKFAGQRCKQLAQLIDIYPTILNVCEIEYGDIDIEGISLVSSNGQMEKERIIFIESQTSPESIYSAAIRKNNYKPIKVVPNFSANRGWKKLAKSILYKIQVPSIQLYNLASDPKEKLNLKRKEKDMVNQLLEHYYKVKASCDKKSKNIKKVEKEVDEEIKEHLRALGYLD